VSAKSLSVISHSSVIGILPVNVSEGECPEGYAKTEGTIMQC